ncbi:MAG: hypothetical protein IH586_20845 [Anaerolineaceae bacterium]|nr:hypothetical protein [Anaerolineaceae bacterium]
MPFYGFGVIRDETVPGLSRLSGNETGTPAGVTTYNQTLLWSASWNAWDGAPVDNPNEWQMSFCAIAPPSDQCGSGQPLTVDITPRRLQRFQVTPGKNYTWQNIRISDRKIIAEGTLTPDENGLLTVPAVEVTPGGIRLRIVGQ